MDMSLRPEITAQPQIPINQQTTDAMQYKYQFFVLNRNLNTYYQAETISNKPVWFYLGSFLFDV